MSSVAKPLPDWKELNSEYQKRVPAYKRLCEEVAFILDKERMYAEGGAVIHSITHRIKSFESLQQKIESGRFSEPLDKVDDIVGFRVVCLLRSHINAVAEFIGAKFSLVKRRDRNALDNPESFGYQDTHCVVTLKESYTGPRYEGLAKQKVEIQIRTLAMDAWDSASHYLMYKTVADVPRDLRRSFHALSGLFYVADTQFEQFYRDRKREIQRTNELNADSDALLDRALDLDALTAFLVKRLPDRRRSTPVAASELIGELANSGYHTIRDVDRLLQRTGQAFAEYEKAHPPSVVKDETDKRFLDVGVVRISLNLMHPETLGELHQKAMAEFLHLIQRE